MSPWQPCPISTSQESVRTALSVSPPSTSARYAWKRPCEDDRSRSSSVGRPRTRVSRNGHACRWLNSVANLPRGTGRSIGPIATADLPPASSVPAAGVDVEERLVLSFSELSAYASCPYAFRLRNRIGFQPRIAQELGYGKAVHHTLRRVADHFRETGRVPEPAEVDALLDASFYLPYASKPAHQQLKAAARRLVGRYLDRYHEDLARIWAVERPFELHIGNAVVSGRADVILDQEGGETASLAIVDYKTSTDRDDDGDVSDYALQLQVYTDAGRKEGLTVRAAYVHDLKAADRLAVDVSEEAIGAAESQVAEIIAGYRAADFTPSPSEKACAGCDMRQLCRFAHH